MRAVLCCFSTPVVYFARCFSTPVDMQSYELCSDMIDVVIDVSCIYGWVGGGSRCWVCFSLQLCSFRLRCCRREEGLAAHDAQSSSIIKLNNGVVLYLREVNRCGRVMADPCSCSVVSGLSHRARSPHNSYLALVCLLNRESFEKHGLIDYNFHCFRDAIQEVFEVRARMLGAAR